MSSGNPPEKENQRVNQNGHERRKNISPPLGHTLVLVQHFLFGHCWGALDYGSVGESRLGFVQLLRRGLVVGLHVLGKSIPRLDFNFSQIIIFVVRGVSKILLVNLNLSG